MATVQNIVELLFKVSDQASGPGKAIAGNMEGIKSAAMAAAAAAVAVGGAMLYAGKKVVDLGTKYEDTSLAIAGAISAFNLAPNIELAEKAAVRALGNIDRMAAKLPGTTEDYVEVFKQGLPAAISAGVTDLDKIADFTSRYTAVATANMVDAQQAGSDLSFMLTGVAGQHVRMWRTLKPLIGKTAEEFNNMTAAARMAAIDKSLEGYSGMLGRVGDTMSAKMGEAEAHIVKIARLAGGPIFDAMLDQLAKMNDYFTKNEKSVVDIGSSIATTVVNALKVVIDNFETIVRVVKNLLELWAAFKIGVVATEITSGLYAIVGAFKAITASATEAAAAEAAASGGLSLLVGVAAAALSYGAMKLMEPSGVPSGAAETKESKAAAAAHSWRLNFERQAQAFAPNLGMKFAARDAFGVKIIPQNIGKQLVTMLGEDFPSFKGAKREGFIEFARQYGIELADKLPTTVPQLPGGPKKADVIIENARFDIKQAFAEGYDPDRIAAAFVEQIGSTALYPGQSGFAAAGTGA
jgi:hypothetical protein